MLIQNPATGVTYATRVMANINPKPYDYFFRRVFAGDRGQRQALIATFFDKFHEACLAAGVPPEWSIENEHLVGDVLNNLNFNPPNNGPKSTRTTRPTSPGRTANSPSKRKAQPAGGLDVGGATA